MICRTKAELINTKTQEIKELFCRSDNRRCDFMDDVTFGRFQITLRLDWGDLDENFQEPTLDADVYICDEKTKKKKKYKSDKQALCVEKPVFLPEIQLQIPRFHT